MINAADYTVWRNAIAAGTTSLTNDPTPGVVNYDDYLYWRSHYGESMGAGTANVPEPTTLATLLIGIIAATNAARRPR